jgi:hypothetical protein
MVFQVLLHDLPGLGYVYRDHDQSLAGKFGGEVVHQRFVAFAVRTPRGPELKQNDFTLCRIVGELFSF